MDRTEAGRLKVGDRVVWTPDAPSSTGTVKEIGYCAVRILWDDQATTSTLHVNDMEHVARAEGHR